MRDKTKKSSEWKIETERLIIKRSQPIQEHIDFIFMLWNDPRVMRFVGFPKGLQMSKEAVEKQLAEQKDDEYDVVLIVSLKDTDEIIGNCKLGTPDDYRKTHTDVKVHPDFWGNKYGIEIKRALLDYLFTHTDCDEVTADPNRDNIASIKMQEAVGGVCVGESTYKFPEHMKDFTCDVRSYQYTVTREVWEKQKG